MIALVQSICQQCSVTVLSSSTFLIQDDQRIWFKFSSARTVSEMTNEANPHCEASATRWTPVGWLKELLSGGKNRALFPLFECGQCPSFFGWISPCGDEIAPRGALLCQSFPRVDSPLLRLSRCLWSTFSGHLQNACHGQVLHKNVALGCGRLASRVRNLPISFVSCAL